MNIIPTDTTAKMSSREIAELMDKQHKHVMRDIKSLVEQGAINGSNFGLVNYTDRKGEERPEFLLDFDATMTLITGYDAKRRAAVIKRWRELETGEAVPAFQIPQTLADALQLAADQARELDGQRKQIETMQPKALFADAVSASDTSILVGDLAKLIRQNGVDMGSKRLFKYLRENGYLIKRKGQDWNMPTQYSMERGWFEIKERIVGNPDGSTRVTRTPKVTGKGQVYFINKFCGDEGMEATA